MPPPLAGDILVASDWGSLSDDSSQKPLGRVVQSVNQPLTDAVDTPLTFTGVDAIDTHNAHDPATNPSRFTPPVPGYYRFTGTCWMTLATTPVRTSVKFRKNGNTDLAPVVEDAFNGRQHGGPQVSLIVDMNGTDYVEFVVLQDSAGNITTATPTGAARSVVEWEFLRDL
jgi:hypothetical protein